MSKKNKKLKQLIKAQIQSNTASVGSISTNQNQTSNSAPTVILDNKNSAIPNKEIQEIVLIKKDVYLSLILIIAITIFILVVYLIDRSNPFLLDLSNKIFKLIQ